ncbi:hypothetical protein WL08_24705 [Burkholderia ubonensis]|nr:hypothetical protein WL08_24705 [Burkholderia ubonensis]
MADIDRSFVPGRLPLLAAACRRPAQALRSRRLSRAASHSPRAAGRAPLAVRRWPCAAGRAPLAVRR